MIIATLKIVPLENKRREVIEILSSIKGPVLAEHGCLSCGIFDECDDEVSLLYLEQWQTMEDFERHVRGSKYGRILEAIEFSALTPEVSFFETSRKWGIELIGEVRNFAKKAV